MKRESKKRKTSYGNHPKLMTHNDRHLAVLNYSNSAELKLSKERLVAIKKWNDEL
jgi:hypothetical protein